MNSPDSRTATAPDERALEASIEKLFISFGNNHVLKGVDLRIARGEIVAIIGASGGGKSVLLKLMIGCLHPSAGCVRMADHEAPGSPLVDLDSLDEQGMDRLRRHWAVVFQKNALYGGTVYENIALGLADVKGEDDQQIRSHVRTVLEAVGLEYSTVAEMQRDEVSGGMAKRVAIARALALDPVLMFYDEPTSGLDPARAGQIQTLIQNVHNRMPEIGIQRTSIIVTHDVGLLYRLRPRIIMLHDGRVYFDGSTDDFQKIDSAEVAPYLKLMPLLHARVR